MNQNCELIYVKEELNIEDIIELLKSMKECKKQFLAFYTDEVNEQILNQHVDLLMKNVGANALIVDLDTNGTKLYPKGDVAFLGSFGSWVLPQGTIISADIFQKLDLYEWLYEEIQKQNYFVMEELMDVILGFCSLTGDLIVTNRQYTALPTENKISKASVAVIMGMMDYLHYFEEFISKTILLEAFLKYCQHIFFVLREWEMYDSVPDDQYTLLAERLIHACEHLELEEEVNHSLQMRIRQTQVDCMKNRRKDQLKELYYIWTGENLELDNPVCFNDKINWLKIYDQNPLKTLCADKYSVRSYIKEKVGENILMPIYGVWDSFEEIPFDELPQEFVLKGTHGSGMNMIVRNKNELDYEYARKTVSRWLSTDFSLQTMELHYHDIPRRIIAEKLIENDGRGLHDYKIHVFNGRAEMIQYVPGRQVGQVLERFYDRDWNALPITYVNKLDPNLIERPKQLDRMIEISEELGKDFAYIRVDLYILNDSELKFSELTFLPSSGMDRWNPKGTEVVLGNLINIDSMRRQMNI